MDKLIVSIGRVPNTTGLNAEAVGLKLDERGAIVVDGDCKDQPAQCLGGGRRGARPDAGAQGRGRGRGGGRAHRRASTARQLRHHPVGDLHQPEIAWVGQTEQQLKADGRRLQGRQLPVHGQRPRARLGDTTGFVKFLATPRPTRSSACTSSARSRPES